MFVPQPLTSQAAVDVHKRLHDWAIFCLLPLRSSSNIPTILNSLDPITFDLPQAVRINASIINRNRSKLFDHIKMKSEFSSAYIMRNTYVNFCNYSLFYHSCVLFICVVCMNDILQLCPHISLHTLHPFFFLTSYSGVPSHLMGFHCFIRNHISSDVNDFILAFEEMCLYQ